MGEMGKISEAILEKVRAEAEAIIKEAEGKAKEEIEQAKRLRAARFEEEKAKLIQEAREEATRIEAQARVKARQELSKAKADVINDIINRVKKALSATSSDKNVFLGLLKETIDALGGNKARVYVAPKDIGMVGKFLENDKGLASKIVEVKEHNSVGGIIVEDVEGSIRIDNTYETRLEMLLPKLLPEIGKGLFQRS